MGLRPPITDPGALLMDPTQASAITRAREYATGVLLLAAAYYAAGRVGFAAAAVHGVVSSMWPPAGIALFALLRFGMRFWPGVAIGAFVLNATSGVPVGGALGIGAGNAIEAIAGWALLTRIAHFNLALAHLRRGRGGDAQSLTVAADLYKTYLLAHPGDADAKWNYELALRDPQGGAGTGGTPPPQPEEPQRPEQAPAPPRGSLDRRQAEQLLDNAARDERDVQGRKQKRAAGEPPRVEKDW